MTRKDLLYLTGMVVIAALLLANLLRPGQPQAFDMPSGAPGVAISSSGDSAWAMVGSTVYFVSLKTRSELDDRIIRVIKAKDLE